MKMIHSMHRKVRGFTLIEVLIAIVLLSIGLLGLASLQANSMKMNHEAYLRSQATVLAMDISDAMRANRGIDATTPNSGTALSGAYNFNFGGMPSPTSNEMHDVDIRNWKTSLANLLPNGDGQITQNGNIFTISIRWADVDDRGTAGSFTTFTTLTAL